MSYGKTEIVDLLNSHYNGVNKERTINSSEYYFNDFETKSSYKYGFAIPSFLIYKLLKFGRKCWFFLNILNVLFPILL